MLTLTLLLLTKTCFSLSAQETQCSQAQSCVTRDQCPAVERLYKDLQQENDPDRRKTITNDLKSKICHKKEKKFCCDCNCLRREECPAIGRLYDDFEQETEADKKQSLLMKLKSKICNFKEKTFCCDTSSPENTITTTIAKPESHDGTFLPRLEEGNCGNIDGNTKFIFGGQQSEYGEFPFTALLRMRDVEKRYNHRFNCGGSLINTRYVLTAAHCYQENNPLNLVRLGEYDAGHEGPDCTDKACLPPVQDFQVSLADFTIHQDYAFDKIANTVYNDIGLIRLPREALINTGVRSVCLPLSPASLQQETPGNNGVIVGWGFTNFLSERLDATRIDFLIAENVQQKANMTIISHEICKDKWGDTLGPLIAGQVCAFGTASTCKGDSGGPLYTHDSQNLDLRVDNSIAPWTLTGITSFGSTYCKGGNKPPIFTRVSHYIDWIKDQLRP